MKHTFKIFTLSLLALVGFASCSEELDENSIFSIKPEVIDMTKFSAPLDSFCKKNFLETYNVDFMYKMEDVSSDVKKNLTPATYERCEEMAVLIKYLWYDVYRNNVGDSLAEGYEFLKYNSPRIIHLVGSKNMNPTQGTEILGTSEGGIKITLYRCNDLDPADLDYCNHYYFHTMHHEFGHQLHSRYVVPLDFRTICAGFYDALGWQETCDSVALGDGFISQYARNNYNDDFVETLSFYVTSTEDMWAERLDRAQFQWEEITYDKDSHGWKEFERIRAAYNRYGGDIDSIGYIKEQTTNKLTIVRKVIKRTSTEKKGDYAYAIPGEDGKPQLILKEEGKTGVDKINKKLDMVKEWMDKNYNVDIDRLRTTIIRRSYVTDENGDLVKGANGKPINRLVQPYQGYPTLVDYLVEKLRNFETVETFDFE